MPELPEVETIRADLARLLPGLRVKKVTVRKPKLLQSSRAEFDAALKRARILRVARRAKQLIIKLSTNYALLIHLKMSGQLVWRSPRGELTVGGHPIQNVTNVPNRYTYITLDFTNGSALYFNDVRQFGYWRTVPIADLAKHLAHLGPEPLSRYFTLSRFRRALAQRRRTSIKAALLDQTIVAGIGNIYADESLYVARLKPSRQVGSLKIAEVTALFRALRRVLKRAVAARGTSMNTYVDGLGRTGTYWEKRLAYGRAGEACPRCGTLFKRIVVAQRGTTYCPNCQK
jgi:formamidopyrimidine-DNA glycosylase